MENSTITNNLTILVEAHDVIALEKNIPKNPDLIHGLNFISLGLSKPQSVREYLRKNKSAVERACELGYLDAVTVFLLHGCSPNLPTSDGRLIHSVLNCLKSKRGHTDKSSEGIQIIRLMISLDCDFNVKDYSHKSPLMIAAELADEQIMKMVLLHCMDWQLYPPSGFTPLHMACMQGSMDCVRQLVSKMTRSSLDTRDDKMYTPLMYSIIMLRNNFQLHSWKNSKEERKLWVMQYKHFSIIEYLLSKGATCPHKDEAIDSPLLHYCQTPLHSLMVILRQCKIFSMFDWLEEISPLPIKKDNYEFLRLISHSFSNSDILLDVQKNDKRTDVLKNHKKAISPYLCLMRLLIYSGVITFDHNIFQTLTKSNPDLQIFFDEVQYFLDQRENTKTKSVSSLLSLCRSTIRLEAGRCDKLHELAFLALPWKLICYIMFVDF